MKLLGFNLTKIDAQRTSIDFQGLKIETKINVKDVKESTQNIIKIKEDVVSVDFSYNILYTNDVGKVSLEGTLLLALESKLYKDLMKQWKDKKMPEEFKTILFNLIIKKSSLKALEIEDDLGLPFHINFPILKLKK